MAEEQRKESVTAQHVKDKASAIEEPLENPKEMVSQQRYQNQIRVSRMARSKRHRAIRKVTRDDQVTILMARHETRLQVAKRRSEDECGGAHRGDYSETAQNVAPQGNKRTAEDEGDVAHRGGSFAPRLA